MVNKSGPNGNNIIWNEDDDIIADGKAIGEISIRNFISVADGIGFPDGLPANYNTNDGFLDIICSHELHLSIFKSTNNDLHTENVFNFTHVNQFDVPMGHGIPEHQKSSWIWWNAS